MDHVRFCRKYVFRERNLFDIDNGTAVATAAPLSSHTRVSGKRPESVRVVLFSRKKLPVCAGTYTKTREKRNERKSPCAEKRR